MFRGLFISICLFLASVASAQHADIQPTIAPDFFTPEDEITISYDVTGTSLSGLEDAWLWLWLPDQDNADVPSNVNPASSDPAKSDAARLTKVQENGRTYFTKSLTLTDFTNKSKEEIQKVGVLIKGNDWSNGQSTDFVFEIFDGYALKVNAPGARYGFYNPGETIDLDIAVSAPSAVSLTIDGELVYAHPDTNAITYEHAVIDDGNVHVIQLHAALDDEELTFTHSYTTPPVVTEAPLAEGKVDGVNYDSEVAATLVLTAPNKESIFVIGDFNNWTLDQDYLMNKDGDRFWLELDDLEPEEEYLYQYLIDGHIIIADPYTEKVSSVFDDWEIIENNRYPDLKTPPLDNNHEASFLQTGQAPYEWEVDDFQKPAVEDLVIYELLVRDFSADRNYRAVIEKLDYLDSLGINAIELMPVTEFEGNLSWGYNPSYMFAQDKYYGTEADLKELIDEAHKRGMAVIFDMVLNHHFGRSPLVKMYSSGDFGPPTADNVWFNTQAKHDYNVGYDFNHESQYTKDYVDRVVTYWTETYKVDGYRFDLSKGFTQKNTLGNVEAWGRKDASRIAIWKRIADGIWAQDPDTYIILEHFADNDEEQELAAYGMMLWGNMNHDYRNTAKGSAVDLGWGYYKTRGWEQPNLVAYMESHDEERVMWDVSRQNKPLGERLNRLKLNATFFFLVPGPKMIWQFGEFGYDEELNNDRLGIKPTRWEYLEDPKRRLLFATYQALVNLKTKTDYLNADNFTWQSSGPIKWINYNNDEVDICAYGNFSGVTSTGDPHILSTGTWYNYFTGEEVEVTSTDQVTLAPGEFYMLTSKPLDNFIEINPQDFVTATSDPDAQHILLYPNPATDHIAIRMNEIRAIRLKDLSGKVMRERMQAEISDQVVLDISALKPGLYLLEVETNKGLINQKIVKQ